MANSFNKASSCEGRILRGRIVPSRLHGGWMLALKPRFVFLQADSRPINGDENLQKIEEHLGSLLRGLTGAGGKREQEQFASVTSEQATQDEFKTLDTIALLLAARDGVAGKQARRDGSSGTIIFRNASKGTDNWDILLRRTINLGYMGKLMAAPDRQLVSSHDAMMHLIPCVTEELGIGMPTICKGNGYDRVMIPALGLEWQMPYPELESGQKTTAQRYSAYADLREEAITFKKLTVGAFKHDIMNKIVTVAEQQGYVDADQKQTFERLVDEAALAGTTAADDLIERDVKIIDRLSRYGL